MIDREPWYSGTVSVGKLGNGFVPNLTGDFYGLQYPKQNPSGVFGTTYLPNLSKATNADSGGAGVSFDASRSSPVYANVDRVIPAYATCLYCIRY